MRTAIVPIIKNKSGKTGDNSNHRPIALVIVCSKITPTPTPPPDFCLRAFNLELHYCAFGTFPKKNSLTECGEKKSFDWRSRYCCKGVSKFKVDMIFIIFHKFNMML